MTAECTEYTESHGNTVPAEWPIPLSGHQIRRFARDDVGFSVEFRVFRVFRVFDVFRVSVDEWVTWRS